MAISLVLEFQNTQFKAYTFVKKHYHGGMKAPLNELTNTLHSVANTTVDFSWWK